MAEKGSPTETFIADLPFLFWLCGGEGFRISRWSKITGQYLGYEDIPQNMPLADLVGDEAANSAALWFADSGTSPASHRFDARLRRKDGTLFPLTLQWGRMYFAGKLCLACHGVLAPPAGSPDGEKISTVAEHSRHDALKIVADGMGHEVNNPLQAIFGYVELATMLNKDPALTPHLKEIMQSAERVKAAVASLKNFTFPDIKN